MDSPFIFRGCPRLSIPFYTIFHKKASENQRKREVLSAFSLSHYHNCSRWRMKYSRPNNWKTTTLQLQIFSMFQSKVNHQ